MNRIRLKQKNHVTCGQHKVKTDKLDIMKMENSYTSQDPTKKVKRQLPE